MIAFVLYGSAGLLTFAYIMWRMLWRDFGDDGFALQVAKPLLEQIKTLWGPLITYLLIATFVLAVPIGFVVIWPLALLVELMINERRAEMKGKPVSPASEESLRQGLQLLMESRKTIDETIAEHQQTLARMTAARDAHDA